MNYNFEEKSKKNNSGSEKWNAMRKIKPTVDADVVPLSVADMEFDIAPQIVSGLQEYIQSSTLGYTSATPDYYESVMNWMQRRHGWKIDKEWIVTSPGVVNALFLVVKAFSEPEDGVIIMPPVYYPFFLAAEIQGRKVIENPLINENGRYQIDFEDLEQKASNPKNKLLLFCSPHNPVGRVWEKQELERVAEICLRNNVLIVADEIHHDIIMPGYKHISFSNISQEASNSCIVCTAPSKSFNLAGFQVSNIVIRNEEIRKKFSNIMKKNALFSLNALAYRACEIAYNECENWLEEMIIYVNQNKIFAEAFIADHIPDISVTPMQGTYLQWYDCRAFGMTFRELEKRMIEADLFLDEGFIFGTGGYGYERINIACPKYILEDALKKMQNVFST